jgi:hypothetical protein
MRLMLGPLVWLTIACGGSTTKAATADAAGVDSGEDATTCPPGSMIPDAAVYMCEAGPAGSIGCHAPPDDPSNTNVYPSGCVMYLPRKAAMCAGQCCPPQPCDCQELPPVFDAGLSFICPL